MHTRYAPKIQIHIPHIDWFIDCAFGHADLAQASSTGCIFVDTYGTFFNSNLLVVSFNFQCCQAVTIELNLRNKLWEIVCLIKETWNLFSFLLFSKTKVFILEESSSVWAVFKNRNNLNSFFFFENSQSVRECMCVSSILSTWEYQKKSEFKMHSRRREVFHFRQPIVA